MKNFQPSLFFFRLTWMLSGHHHLHQERISLAIYSPPVRSVSRATRLVPYLNTGRHRRHGGRQNKRQTGSERQPAGSSDRQQRNSQTAAPHGKKAELGRVGPLWRCILTIGFPFRGLFIFLPSKFLSIPLSSHIFSTHALYRFISHLFFEVGRRLGTTAAELGLHRGRSGSSREAFGQTSRKKG